MLSSDRSTVQVNRDVLLELLVRLDDDALRKMYSSPLWYGQIRALLTNPTTNHAYWYGRSQHLVGKQLDDNSGDWKEIYYSLEFRKSWEDIAIKRGKPNDWEIVLRDMKPAEIKAILGLDNIWEFNAMKQAYPVPRGLPRSTEETLWGTISDPTVFRAAIQAGLIEVDDKLVSYALDAASAIGDKELIEFLLSLLSTLEMRKAEELQILYYVEGPHQTEIVRELLSRITDQGAIDQALIRQSATKGNEETIELLMSRVADPEIIRQSLRMAGKRNNSQAVRVLLTREDITLEDKQGAFVLAYHAESEDSMLVLIERDTRVIDLVDKNLLYSDDFLDREAKAGHTRIVALLLKNISPFRQDNAPLRDAAPHLETFSLILSDPRVDPMLNIVGTIGSSRSFDVRDIGLIGSMQNSVSLTVTTTHTNEEPLMNVGTDEHMQAETVADLVIRDPRVDIERLNRDQLRFLFWSLQSHIADRVEGLQKGRELAGAARMRTQDLGTLLELRDDIYAKLLRYVILKRPSSVELLDWMIAQTGTDREMFAFAAQDTLDDIIEPDNEITPIWSLLQVALYPTLTLERLVDRLRTAGVDQGLITRSAQLVGAHLGASKLE